MTIPILTPEKIEKIKSNFSRQCIDCKHMCGGGHDYESMSWGGGYCNKEGKEHVSNLRSFPFKKQQKCFVPSYEYLLSVDEELHGLESMDTMGEDTEQDKVIRGHIDRILSERYNY